MTDVTSRLSTALADRYCVERELGAGGMATVYLAVDLKHDRKVAIKVLRPELAAERFVREIKTTAALQHPHILQSSATTATSTSIRRASICPRSRRHSFRRWRALGGATLRSGTRSPGCSTAPVYASNST